MSKCLFCYRPLKTGEKDMHPACCENFWHDSITDV